MGKDGKEEAAGGNEMIVPMKKVYIVIKREWSDETLGALGEMGLIHLQHVNKPESEKTRELRNRIGLMEKALSVLSSGFGVRGSEYESKSKITGDGFAIAEQILSLAEDARKLEEEIRSLEEEYNDVKIWGSFDPEDLELLRNSGVSVRLYRCSEREMKNIPEGVESQVIHREGSILYIAVVSMESDMDIPFEEIGFPERGPDELKSALEEKRERLKRLRGEISALTGMVSKTGDELARARERLRYEEAAAGMGREEELSYLAGFVPSSEAERVVRLAAEKRWAVLVEDPSGDDPVPTLLEQSRWSRMFQPVMDFTGVVPGYFEYDTNGIFLLFFALFFAMIVGDGGYGIVLLAASYAENRFYRMMPGEIVHLLYVLSAATILWGAVTGSWFGVESLGQLPLLKHMVIPEFSGFTIESESAVINLCFLLASLHLSLAHVWKGARFYPSFKLFSEAGWVALIWGIYFLVRFLILKENMESIGLYLLGTGVFLILLFSEQEKDGLLRGIMRSITRFPVIILTGIESFSNIVSYIRLFAVGLATREVAVVFNGMAENIGFGSISSVLVAMPVLLFGHTLNILLCALAVLVHAVRLNLLEFSGQMNMEWSGIPFNPFRKEMRGGKL